MYNLKFHDLTILDWIKYMELVSELTRPLLDNKIICLKLKIDFLNKTSNGSTWFCTIYVLCIGHNLIWGM